MENQVKDVWKDLGETGDLRVESLVWGGQEGVGRPSAIVWLSVRVLVAGSKDKKVQPLLTVC